MTTFTHDHDWHVSKGFVQSDGSGGEIYAISTLYHAVAKGCRDLSSIHELPFPAFTWQEFLRPFPGGFGRFGNLGVFDPEFDRTRFIPINLDRIVAQFLWIDNIEFRRFDILDPPGQSLLPEVVETVHVRGSQCS